MAPKAQAGKGGGRSGSVASVASVASAMKIEVGSRSFFEPSVFCVQRRLTEATQQASISKPALPYRMPQSSEAKNVLTFRDWLRSDIDDLRLQHTARTLRRIKKTEVQKEQRKAEDALRRTAALRKTEKKKFKVNKSDTGYFDRTVRPGDWRGEYEGNLKDLGDKLLTRPVAAPEGKAVWDQGVVVQNSFEQTFARFGLAKLSLKEQQRWQEAAERKRNAEAMAKLEGLYNQSGAFRRAVWNEIYGEDLAAFSSTPRSPPPAFEWSLRQGKGKGALAGRGGVTERTFDRNKEEGGALQDSVVMSERKTRSSVAKFRNPLAKQHARLPSSTTLARMPSSPSCCDAHAHSQKHSRESERMSRHSEKERGGPKEEQEGGPSVSGSTKEKGKEGTEEQEIWQRNPAVLRMVSKNLQKANRYLSQRSRWKIEGAVPGPENPPHLPMFQYRSAPPLVFTSKRDLFQETEANERVERENTNLRQLDRLIAPDKVYDYYHDWCPPLQVMSSRRLLKTPKDGCPFQRDLDRGYWTGCRHSQGQGCSPKAVAQTLPAGFLTAAAISIPSQDTTAGEDPCQQRTFSLSFQRDPNRTCTSSGSGFFSVPSAGTLSTQQQQQQNNQIARAAAMDGTHAVTSCAWPPDSRGGERERDRGRKGGGPRGSEAQRLRETGGMTARALSRLARLKPAPFSLDNWKASEEILN